MMVDTNWKRKCNKLWETLVRGVFPTFFIGAKEDINNVAKWNKIKWLAKWEGAWNKNYENYFFFFFYKQGTVSER